MNTKFNWMFTYLKDYFVILAFIFLPQLKISGFIIPTFYLFIVWGIIQSIRFKKLFFSSLLKYVYLIQFLFLSFSNAYNGYVEFSLVKEMILFPIFYTSGAVIISNILKRQNVSYLIRIIAYALITNSVLIILLISFKDLNPTFHEFIHITQKNYKYIYEMPLNFRHSGLGVSGFSYLSFKTVCLYFIILFYSHHHKNIKNHLIHITSILVILSLIFVARTGLFLGISGYLLYMYLNNKKIFITIMIVVFITFTSIINYFYVTNESNVTLAIERSFDLFLSENENGAIKELSYESKSFKLNNILLGEKNYGRDKGLISDIGFISLLSGGGIIGVIVLTMHWFIIILKTMKNNNHWVKKALYYLAIVFLLLNGKELVFYGHGYMQAMIILMILYEQKRNNNYNGLILS